MRRFTIAFGEEISGTIGELREGTTAEGDADVVRNAMSTYAFVADEIVKDPRLRLVTCEGDEPRRLIFVPGVNDTRWRRFRLYARWYARRLNEWFAARWR